MMPPPRTGDVCPFVLDSRSRKGHCLGAAAAVILNREQRRALAALSRREGNENGTARSRSKDGTAVARLVVANVESGDRRNTDAGVEGHGNGRARPSPVIAAVLLRRYPE